MPVDSCQQPTVATPGAVEVLVARLNLGLKRRESVDEAALRQLLDHFDASHADSNSLLELLLRHGLDQELTNHGIKELLECKETLCEFLKLECASTWPQTVDSVDLQLLPKKIHLILAASDSAESEGNGGRFRELCRLAVEWGRDPETYRRLLISCGLTLSRASEIKRVLECAAARDAFLARTHSITWQDALDRSRQQGQSEEELKAHKLKLLSQQLVRLVVGQMAKQGGADLERKELGVFRTGSECFKLVLKKRVTFGGNSNRPSNLLPARSKNR